MKPCIDLLFIAAVNSFGALAGDKDNGLSIISRTRSLSGAFLGEVGTDALFMECLGLVGCDVRSLLALCIPQVDVD